MPNDHPGYMLRNNLMKLQTEAINMMPTIPKLLLMFLYFFCKSLWNKDNRWFSGCLCTDRFYPHFTVYAKIASEISTGDMVRKLDCRLCCFRQSSLFFRKCFHTYHPPHGAGCWSGIRSSGAQRKNHVKGSQVPLSRILPGEWYY